MRKIIRYLFLAGALSIFPLSTSAYSIISKSIDGHKVRIFHIPKNDSYKVTIGASNSGLSLKEFVSNLGGVAGINGAYFIPKDYTGKPDSTNAMRIIQGDGKKYSRYFPDTGINGLFGFMKNGEPLLIQNNLWGNKDLQINIHSGRISEIYSGIANFPILLIDGENILPKYTEAGLITDKMKAKTAKSFICSTKENDIKMGVISLISIEEMPEFIKRFGCTNSINLDSGGSLAIYNQGKYIVGPGRNIMDAFIIVKK